MLFLQFPWFFFFLLVSLKTPFCKQSPLILLLPPSKMYKLLTRRLGARKYVSVCVCACVWGGIGETADDLIFIKHLRGAIHCCSESIRRKLLLTIPGGSYHSAHFTDAEVSISKQLLQGHPGSTCLSRSSNPLLTNLVLRSTFSVSKLYLLLAGGQGKGKPCASSQAYDLQLAKIKDGKYWSQGSLPLNRLLKVTLCLQLFCVLITGVSNLRTGWSAEVSIEDQVRTVLETLLNWPLGCGAVPSLSQQNIGTLFWAVLSLSLWLGYFLGFPCCMKNVYCIFKAWNHT